MHLDSEVLNASLSSGHHALHFIDEETEAQKLERLGHNYAAGYGESQAGRLLMPAYKACCSLHYITHHSGPFIF